MPSGQQVPYVPIRSNDEDSEGKQVGCLTVLILILGSSIVLGGLLALGSAVGDSSVDLHCHACLARDGMEWCGNDTAASRSTSGCVRWHSQLSAGCISQSIYCGVEWCKKLELVPELHNTPYPIMFLSIVALIMFNVVVTSVISAHSPLNSFFHRLTCGRIALNTEVYSGGATRYDVFLTACFAGTNPYLYVVQYILCFIHLFWICYEVFSQQAYDGFGLWQRYDAIVLLWMAGSTPSVLGSCFGGLLFYFLVRNILRDRGFTSDEGWDYGPIGQMTATGSVPASGAVWILKPLWTGKARSDFDWMYDNPTMDLMFDGVIISLAPLLPLILTHIIPAWVLYCWMFALLAAALCVPPCWLRVVCKLALARTPGSVKGDVYMVISFAIMRILCSFGIATFLVQTPTIWAHLKYSGESYLGVPGADYNARNIECYMHMLRNRYATTFFSFFTLMTD